MPVDAFHYDRRVAFSDTDAMGVTHHANYLRYCEEARVAWMRARGLVETHYPHTNCVLALLEYHVWHLKTSTFDDALRIYLQTRQQGVRVTFQYAMYKGDVRICEARTLHIPVDHKELKPMRPFEAFVKVMEKEKWTETLLSNS